MFRMSIAAREFNGGFPRRPRNRPSLRPVQAIWRVSKGLDTGLIDRIRALRARVLERTYAAAPERFVRGTPRPPKLPTAGWINPPPEATGKERTLQ